MINKSQLEQLAKSDFGKVLIDYLDEKIKEMTDITKIETQKELTGKKNAVKILRELFSFLKKERENKPEPKKTNYL